MAIAAYEQSLLAYSLPICSVWIVHLVRNVPSLRQHACEMRLCLEPCFRLVGTQGYFGVFHGQVHKLSYGSVAVMIAAAIRNVCACCLCRGLASERLD